MCLIASLAEAAPAKNHPCNATAGSPWGCDPKPSLEDLVLPKMGDRTGPGNHSRTESGVGKIKNKCQGKRFLLNGGLRRIRLAVGAAAT